MQKLYDVPVRKDDERGKTSSHISFSSTGTAKAASSQVNLINGPRAAAKVNI